jgi:hypothetical protein
MRSGACVLSRLLLISGESYRRGKAACRPEKHPRKETNWVHLEGYRVYKGTKFGRPKQKSHRAAYPNAWLV